jgi:hypothetical protein
MRTNGSGTNGHGNGSSERPTFEEALAALGEPHDQLDKLATFTATQIHNLVEMMLAMGGRIDALESEIAKLKAERSGHSSTPPRRH